MQLGLRGRGHGWTNKVRNKMLVTSATFAGCTIPYDEEHWGTGVEGYTEETCATLCDRVAACQLWAWWGEACWLKNTNFQCTAKVKETMTYHNIL